MPLPRCARPLLLAAAGCMLGACQIATPSVPGSPSAAIGSPPMTLPSSTPNATPPATVHPGSSLRGIELLVPEGTGGPLEPAFSPATTTYTFDVDSDIAAVGVVPAAEDPGAVRIAVGGAGVSSGQASMVSVGVGSTRVDIEVSAIDGSPATTYTIDVERRDMSSVIARFRKLSFTDPATGETMGYRLFVPDGYDPSRSYPLVLFLHGAGERGSDNEAQLTANEGATIWATPEEQAKHPAFVLAPQSGLTSSKQGWTTLASHGQNDPFRPQKELITAHDILELVRSQFNIDPRRIYATGVSQGGFGTFAIAIAHPDEFAAIVPICGGGDPAKLATISKMPIWIFHAAKDPTVRVGFSRNSVAALKKAGGHPRYTEYPASAYFYPTAHASWTSTYANPEMRDWVFAQSR